MNCSDVCLDMDYDGDTNEFYTESLVKARRPHKCCECRDVIVTGAQYQRASGKAEGEMWTAKTCLLCYEIRRAFVCGSCVFGQLREEIENAMFPIWSESGPFDCLAKLDTVEARRKVNRWHDEWKLAEGRGGPTP